MKCEVCNQAEATISVVNILANQKCEMHMCAACADVSKIVMKSLQGSEVEAFLQETVQELSKAIEGILIPQTTPVVKKSIKKCDKCGITLDEIVKTGKLGCPYDYEIFGEDLKSGLRCMHNGGLKHTGKYPSSASNVEQLKLLKEKLSKAVETENYEEAAALRDKIKNLQQKEEMF